MPIAFEYIPKEFVSTASFYDYKSPITEALSKINANGAVVVLKENEYYGIVDDRSIARKGNVALTKNFSISKFAIKTPLLNKETTIDKAIYHFYESGAKALPYYENGRISGVVKRNTIVKTILSLHMLSKYNVSDIMSTPVIAIDSDATVSEARTRMQQNGINRLIVLSNKKLFGIITYRDLLDYSVKLRERAEKLERHISLGRRVAEITERNVYSIDYSSGVDDAVRDLIEKNVSSLIVTRNGNPVGVITIRDLLEAAVNLNKERSENIMISGLDSYTKNYESEIMDELEGMIEKLSKFNRLTVDGVSLHLRRSRLRNYEMRMRIWLGRSGAVSVASSGYSMEKVLKELIERAYNLIKNRRDMIYSEKKHMARLYEE